MSEFTPGPWHVFDDWYIRAKDGCGSLASVCKPIDPKIGDDECKANAQLIARAPEMAARIAELTALCEDKETRLLSAARQIANLKLDQHERITDLTAESARLRELLTNLTAWLTDEENKFDQQEQSEQSEWMKAKCQGSGTMAFRAKCWINEHLIRVADGN